MKRKSDYLLALIRQRLINEAQILGDDEATQTLFETSDDDFTRWHRDAIYNGAADVTTYLS